VVEADHAVEGDSSHHGRGYAEPQVFGAAESYAGEHGQAIREAAARTEGLLRMRADGTHKGQLHYESVGPSGASAAHEMVGASPVERGKIPTVGEPGSNMSCWRGKSSAANDDGGAGAVRGERGGCGPRGNGGAVL
jgi:hypothetical protein